MDSLTSMIVYADDVFDVESLDYNAAFAPGVIYSDNSREHAAAELQCRPSACVDDVTRRGCEPIDCSCMPPRWR